MSEDRKHTPRYATFSFYCRNDGRDRNRVDWSRIDCDGNLPLFFLGVLSLIAWVRARRTQDRYDLIVKIDWFDKLHNPDDGWEIIRSNQVQKENDERTLCVAVLGLYNKGKTFVLNRIGGTNLPEGVDEHTLGISLKRAAQAFKRFTLVDIAGFARLRVKVRSNYLVLRHFVTESLVEDDETQRLDHRKMVDLFIQDVVLWMAAGCIVVVGDLTLNDQQYLSKLRTRLHEFKTRFATVGDSGDLRSVKNGRLPDLIVIHNFAMERDLKKCARAFEKQIIANYKNGHWLDGENVRHYVTKEIAGSKGKAGMRHVFVGRSSDPGSVWSTEMDRHNARVFNLVRHWIIHGTSQDRQISSLDEIVRCCNVVLPEYTNKPPDDLVLTEDKKLVSFVQKEEPVDPNDKLMFLYDEKAQEERNAAPPKEPPYDILHTDDAVYVHLDSCAKDVALDFDPHLKKLQVEGDFPKPKHYSYKNNRLVRRRRYVDAFNFTVDLSQIPGQPPLFEPELVEEEVEESQECESSPKRSVIKFKIQKRVTTKKESSMSSEN